MKLLPAALTLLFAFSILGAQAQPPTVVSVLYAGSLVSPMEGAVKTSLRAEHIDFQGEPGGSKALAHLISAGLRDPDVFISVDPQLIVGLGSKVASATTFAGTSLGIGWSDHSRYASLFSRIANGKTSVLAALKTPGLVIARTDPALDPKGTYTIKGVTLLAGADGEKRLLGADENNAQIFPEEDLLTRIDSGDADVGFFYKTEAIARGLHFVPLPGKAALTDTITYTLAVMKNPPHPQAAQAFAISLLHGAIRSILEKAGIRYFR